jgi:dTDP-4-dehydrorhamnose reductase
MIKIYLAGSTGQLGSSLKELILKQKKYKLITKRIDLTKKTKTKFFLEKINPDIIINCSGLTNIEECQKNKRKALLLNSNIPKNLSSFCLNNNKYFIHISTDHLYDSLIKENNNEKNKLIRNFYAKSKYLGECNAKNENSLIIRTNFFGHLKKRKGLVYWIEQSAKKNKDIILYKNIYFSPLYIITLCKIILKIIPKKITGIFNIGSNKGMSKSNFIKKIIKKKNIKIKYKVTNYKYTDIRRPKNMLMNVKKFENKFLIKLPNLKDEISKIK